MDKQIHEKIPVTKSSDGSIATHTVSGNKTQMGNIMKKSRWDQPPSDEDNSKDTSRNPGSNTKVITETRGHSSSQNIESGSSRGSVKELVSKFEIISGSAKRNPASNKGHLSGNEQTGCEENDFNRNSGIAVKEREEHSQRGHVEQGKDIITDSGDCEQSLPKMASRVKLVRTNFNAAAKQDSTTTVKSEDEKGNLSYSDGNSNDTKSSSETTYVDEKRELLLKEEQKDGKKGQKKDDCVDEDLPSAEGVITSTALQMISSYDDSPSEDSLSEPENVSANEPSFSVTKKLSDTQLVDQFEENNEICLTKEFDQIKSKEVNDISKETSTADEHAVTVPELVEVCDTLKDTKEETVMTVNDDDRCIAETSSKPKSHESEPVLPTCSEMEVPEDTCETRSGGKVSEKSCTSVPVSDSDGVLLSESRDSDSTSKDNQNLQLARVVNETDRLTIGDYDTDKDNAYSSAKSENISKLVQSQSENVEEISEIEQKIIEKVSDITITDVSKNLNSESKNIGEKEDVKVSSGDCVLKNYSSELEDTQTELQSKSNEEKVNMERREDSNETSNLEDLNIQVEPVVEEMKDGEKLNIESEQDINKVDDKRKNLHSEREKNSREEHIDSAEENLQNLETINKNKGSNEAVHTGQSNDCVEKEEVESETADNTENMAKDMHVSLQNEVVDNENEVHIGAEKSDERGVTNKVTEKELVEEEKMKTSDMRTDSGEQECSSVRENVIGEIQGSDVLKGLQVSGVTESLEDVCEIQTDTGSKPSVSIQKETETVETCKESEHVNIEVKANLNDDLCVQSELIEDSASEVTASDNTAIELSESVKSTVTTKITAVFKASERNESASNEDSELCVSGDSESLSSIPLPVQEDSVQESRSSDVDSRKSDLTEKTGVNKKQTNRVSSTDLMDTCEDNAVDGSSVFESVGKSKSEELHDKITDNVTYESKDTDYMSSLDICRDLDMDVSSIPLPDVCEDEKQITTTTIQASGEEVHEENKTTEKLADSSPSQEDNQTTEVSVENKNLRPFSESMVVKEGEAVKLGSSVVIADVSSGRSKEEVEKVSCNSDQALTSQSTDEIIGIEEELVKEGEYGNADTSKTEEYHSVSTVLDVAVDDENNVESISVSNKSNDECLDKADPNIEDGAVEAVEQSKIDELVSDKLGNSCLEENTEVTTSKEEITSISELQTEGIDAVCEEVPHPNYREKEKSCLGSQNVLEDNLLEEQIDEAVHSVPDNIENSELFEEESVHDGKNIHIDKEKCDTSTKTSAELVQGGEESVVEDLKIENNLSLYQENIRTKTPPLQEVDKRITERKVQSESLNKTDSEDICEIQLKNKNKEGDCKTVETASKQDVEQEVCETAGDQDRLTVELIDTKNSVASVDQVGKIFDIKSSESTSTLDSSIQKEVLADVSKVDKNTEGVEEGETGNKEEAHTVLEDVVSNSKEEENGEIRREDSSISACVSDSLENKWKTQEEENKELGELELRDKDTSTAITSCKEKEILNEESLLKDVLLESESRNEINSDEPVVESCTKELKTDDDDMFSNIAQNVVEEDNSISIDILRKDETIIKTLPDLESDEKQKCQNGEDTVKNVNINDDSVLQPAILTDVNIKEDVDKINDDVVISEEQNKDEECNLGITDVEKLSTGEKECNRIENRNVVAGESTTVEIIESDTSKEGEREIGSQNPSEKEEDLLEEAVHIDNEITKTSKVSVQDAEIHSSKEGKSNIHKRETTNETSSKESSSDDLVNKNNVAVASEIVGLSASVVPASETAKGECKVSESSNQVEAEIDKKIFHLENDDNLTTKEVAKSDAELPSADKTVVNDSNVDTAAAPCKSVSLKRPQSSSVGESIVSDYVSEQPASSTSKLIVSAAKKQKLAESVQSKKEECQSESVSIPRESVLSSESPREHSSEERNVEKIGKKEKIQPLMRPADSAIKSGNNSESSSLETPLESRIYKALGERREVCITKVAPVHKPHKQEDFPSSPQTSESGSIVTSHSRSPHLFTKDGKLFSSQDDVVKELPQVKLEPITLKLSRDNTSITRAESVSPKKTSDANAAGIRAESVSPKKTTDYVRSSDSPKSQLSPKTKTLGYTLKIGKDSTTIVPKESKLSPRIKEHSPGTSSSSCLKSSDLSKVEHMLKETGVTITPVSSSETQESQKLSKITLKLSKAGGHPEIKQEKSETWKTVQKLTEVDIVPVQDAARTHSIVQQFKRKDNVESHIPEKKRKLSPGKELTVTSGASLPEQSKLQGLLAKTSHIRPSHSPHPHSSSSDVQIVGVIPPKDPLSVQCDDTTSSGSVEVPKPVEPAVVKQEVAEIRPQPKKRGRPRKVVVPVIPPPVHIKEESDPSGSMFPTPLFNLTDDAFGEGHVAGPPTLFPDQVQPGRRPKRACSGRIKLPVVRSRRPRGSGIVRGVTRGRGRGRGMKRKYDDMEFPGSSLNLENLENQTNADVSGKDITEGDENKSVLSSPVLKKEVEGSNAGMAEIQKELKVATKKSKKEMRRLKREDKRAKKKSGAGNTPIALPPPQMFEEETRMSATESNSRSQTPARATGVDGMGEESQGSLLSTPGEQSSTTKENNRNKKGRMEVIDLESSKEFTVDQITEYQWPLQGGELWMIQEQISLYLGVKSFKRKYPEIKRRPVEPEERQYLCDNGLVSESMCDLGLTSVSSAEILDIMFQDFQDKYEEFRKHIREKQARELSNKQKASEKKKGEQGPQKLDIKEQAIQSAASWNQSFNKSRLEQRRCALDLQTWTIQFPRSRIQKMTRPTPKLGTYPVAVIPGQFCDYYKSYTPQELRYFPLNTVLYGPMKPNERHHMGGSDGSQSESEESSSSDDSSDSSSDGEATCEEEEKDIKDVLSPIKSEQLKVQTCPPPICPDKPLL